MISIDKELSLMMKTIDRWGRGALGLFVMLLAGTSMLAASGCASCCCEHCLEKRQEAAKFAEMADDVRRGAPAHEHGEGEATASAPVEPPGPAEPAWQPLFDGESMGKWQPAEFGGNGEIEIEEGAIRMAVGSPLTGVTWAGDAPMKIDYEIEFDAQRIDGSDFFVGLTFPVGENPCTLVMGGWGGGMTGLSSINGNDASENDTSQWIKYDNGRWYHVRLRVTGNRIAAWLDGNSIIDADIEGKQVGIRIEVEDSRPLGFACFASTAAVKNIRWRPVEASGK